MKLQFDATLPFQRDAINAVVDLFAGQPAADSSGAISFNAGALLQTELGLANNLALTPDTLLANLNAVQTRNQITPLTAYLPPSPNYAIEMETGTGKTYVYLRTAFELHKLYGFAKFVIVVPSVPIREGVLHSLATMRDHFSNLYDAVPFDYAVYDSKQLGRLRSFATANHLQFMVINIQAFQRDAADDDSRSGRGAANVIYVEQDRLSGHRPIEYLQRTNPIVIIDEPQKMEGEASTRAIQRLNPLCTLRYSATYESDAKVYRLGPIEALERKLVKRIEVASVVPDDNVNEAYIELVKVDIRTQKATVKINVGTGSTVKQRNVTIRGRDDLWVKSKERQEYRTGYQVAEISFRAGEELVRFGNGQTVSLGSAANDFGDEVMREQIRVTIEEHLRAEKQLRERGIKVLSLFFIDHVANYRQYHDDGRWSLGKIGRWFEATFQELAAQPRFHGMIADPVATIHSGYFSADRQGAYRDTSGKTKEDDSTYELIMREKERLLSFDTPLRFIFSHSALREGWDNPNVFQICTLNESRSVVRKRQEIGRGLRLPVNQQGERIHDEGINRLIVVANESYHDFARKLQTEYEEELGVQFGVVPVGAFSTVIVADDEHDRELGLEESADLWRHLQSRGYIEADGTLSEQSFKPGAAGFELEVPAELTEARARIVDVLTQYQFAGRVVRDARRRMPIEVRKHVLDDPEFQALWRQISQRTRYRIALDTSDLIENAARRIADAPDIRPPDIRVDIAEVDVTRAGVGVREANQRYRTIERSFPIPDVLAYLQNETELTRQTLAQILVRSGKAEQLRLNPQAFITMASKEIKAALRERTLGGIRYERTGGDPWSVWRLEQDASQELGSYVDSLYPVRGEGKSPFNYVEFDSQVEREFAEKLDNDRTVRYFLKLPDWFTVDTPVGAYNPDWAICLAEENAPDQVYLVAETKGSVESDQLRGSERDKIACGRKHFAAIDVRYNVASSFDEIARAYASRSPSP